MPFFLDYRMWSGVGRREVLTPAEAVVAHAEIRLAGGGQIVVTDQNGRLFTLDELKARSPKAPPSKP